MHACHRLSTESHCDSTCKCQADGIAAEKKLLCLKHARAGECSEVEAIVDGGLPVDYADPDTGDTILMLSAAAGNEQLVDFCIRKGANADLENVSHGCSAEEC